MSERRVSTRMRRMRMPGTAGLLLLGMILWLSACADPSSSRPASAYPLPADPDLVGTYPMRTKSGAGHFFDEVLEYRVWVHPERGGADPRAGSDHFRAFETYEKALEYSTVTRGSEAPLVLIRQREWIDEPEPGTFVHRVDERITEWRVEWLAGSQRRPDSIARFLEEKGSPK